MSIESVEQRIARAESLLIALSIAAIAAADFVVGPGMSLGPLYLIPLSYSAFTQSWKATAAVFLVCLVLRETLGPLGASSDPWFFFLRDLLIAAIFVATAVYLARLGHQRREFFELARAQRDELAEEIELAAQLQKRLLELNQAPESELDIVARTVQLKGVGGDYYDFVPLDEDRTGVVLADVAGKGLRAALLMPAVRIALRSAAQQTPEPGRIVAELDRMIYRTTEARNYATLILVAMDLRDGAIEYVNAGHLPGLLLSPEGEIRWLTVGGPPVGLLPDATYRSDHAHLAPGGSLLLFTDGLTESTDPAGEEFGTERLATVVARMPGQPAAAIVDAIRNELLGFIDGGSLQDDVSVIAIRRRLPREREGGERSS